MESSRRRSNDTLRSEDTDVDISPWKNVSRANSETSIPPVPENFNDTQQDQEGESFLGDHDPGGNPIAYEQRFSGMVQPMFPEDYQHFHMHWDSHLHQHETHVPPPPDHDEHDLIHGVAVNSSWDENIVRPDEAPQTHHISGHHSNDLAETAEVGASPNARGRASTFSSSPFKESDSTGARSPPRRQWATEKRFSIHEIAVTEAGVQRTSSSPTSYQGKRRCCRVRCCRSCYCCTSYLSQENLSTPVFMMVCSLIFVISFSWLSWAIIDPSIAEGGFGLLIQTDQEEAVNIRHFHKARPSATAYLKSSQAGMPLHSTIANNAGIPTGMGQAHWWGHVEFIFYVKDGNLVTAERLHEVRNFEKFVRQLPGWQHFCNKVPDAQRYYCSPGETLANAAFGQETLATSAGLQQSVTSEVQFNGRGQQFVMPMQSLITYLRDFRTAAYRRWLLDESESDVSHSPVRSVFSFYLSDGDRSAWEKFVRDELEPAIEEQIMKAEEQEETAGRIMHIFYRISRLESQEFGNTVRGDIVYTHCVAIIALVAALLTTRRFLLGVAAMVLAIISQTAASAFLATQGLHGSSDAYPAISVGSWFLVTVSCTDLAIASLSAWTASSRYMLKFQGSWLQSTCLLGRYLLEAPAPMLAQTLALLISGNLVSLPLYTEFAHHAGLGMAIALTLAVVVFPPAIQLSERLNQKSLQSEDIMRCGRRISGLVPYEFGGSSWCCQFGRGLSKRFVNAFRSKAIRGASLVTLLAVVLGVFFSVPPIGPELQYDWATPDLFSEDHRLRIAPQIQARFGMALPGPTEPPSVAVQSARKCLVDAHDNAGCSWMSCDRDETSAALSDSCQCSYQSTAAPSTLSECGVVARFSGPGSEEFAQTYFWSWLENQLNATIVNSTVPVAPMNAFLQIEDWSAGSATTWSQIEMKFRKSDTSVLLWEDACFKTFCNCGPWKCLLEGAHWTKLHYTPSNSDRRMRSDQDTFLIKDRQEPPEDFTKKRFLGALPHSRVRRKERRLEVARTVFAVWGLQKTETIPSRSIRTTLSFDPNFDITSPWAQRHMFRSCDGPAPALGVISTTCWAVDFQRWLSARGEVFPVRSAEFYGFFELFTADMEKSRKTSTTTDSVEEASYNYFWVDSYGLVKGCFASFNVEIPPNGPNDYLSKWEAYILQRKMLAPELGSWSTPWITSDLFAGSSSVAEMQEAARSLILSAIFCTAIVVLLLTCSCGLMIASLGILAFAVGVIVCLVIGAEQRTIGIMEIVALAAFMTSLITPMIRVLQQYSLSQEMPRSKVKKSERQSQASPPRRASQQGIDFWSYSDRKLPQEREAGSRKIEFLSKDNALDTYLVDNQLFQARTQGLGYRLSPMLQDLDKTSSAQRNMAEWGSVVTGVPHGPDWLRVEARFLPMTLFKNGEPVPVLTLIEPENSEMPELLFDEDEGDSNDDEEDDEAADIDDYSDNDEVEYGVQPTELTVYTHLIEHSSDLDSDESDNDALCNCDCEKARQKVRDASIRFWFGIRAYLVGSHGHMSLKPGMVAEERYQRLVKTLRMTTQTVIGSSIAGCIVGLAFLPLAMATLGRIGLAIFFAAISAPHAALVVAPTILLLGFGPTRTARVAFARYFDWWMAGKPKRGAPMRQDGRFSLHGGGGSSARRPTVAHQRKQELIRKSMARSMSEVGDADTTSNMKTPRVSFASPASQDPGALGEVAARVLGFPFNIGINTPAKDQKMMKPGAPRLKAAAQPSRNDKGEVAMVNIWSTSYVGVAPKKGHVIL